jgi:putative addiction module killer protein
MMITKKYKFYKTDEYQEWLEQETYKSQTQIAERLLKIELEGYFGTHKYLSDNIWELKWVNGRRLYYAYFAEINIILLLGGNKNGQNKDITRAKKIFKKQTVHADDK